MVTNWLGKALGGVLGFAAAGPPGFLVGLLLGHQYDQGVGNGPRGADFSSASGEISRLFFTVTFEAMGHVAKVDGRVSDAEIREARRIMYAMQLSPEQTRAAIEHFTTGKDSRHPLAARLAVLAGKLDQHRDLARTFVEIQMQAAIGAGPVGREKRRVLWQIASALGLGRVELAQIEALLRARSLGTAADMRPAALEEADRARGVEPEASDVEVKKADRRLINQHHPDKRVARGLPESMAAVADRKTHEIRAAYERIRDERGVK